MGIVVKAFWEFYFCTKWLVYACMVTCTCIPHMYNVYTESRDSEGGQSTAQSGQFE